MARTLPLFLPRAGARGWSRAPGQRREMLRVVQLRGQVGSEPTAPRPCRLRCSQDLVSAFSFILIPLESSQVVRSRLPFREEKNEVRVLLAHHVIQSSDPQPPAPSRAGGHKPLGPLPANPPLMLD